jgi:hypothetical protein
MGTGTALFGKLLAKLPVGETGQVCSLVGMETLMALPPHTNESLYAAALSGCCWSGIHWRALCNPDGEQKDKARAWHV